MTSKDIQALIPVNVTSRGKRNFAGVIKLRASRWGDDPELSGEALNGITKVFKRQRQREI